MPKYSRSIHNQLVTVAVAACIILGAHSINANENQVYKFDIQTKAADQALQRFAIQTNNEVVFESKVVEGITTAGVKGEYTEQEALELILANTGLILKRTEDNVYLVSAEGSQRNTKKKSINSTQSGNQIALEATRNYQEKKPSKAYEEIIVTANKREQNLLDIPFSVTALNGKDLDAKGISDLQSLSFSVPSLYMAGDGGYQSRVSIRGIGNVFGSSSLVGIYLDETSVAGAPASQLDLRFHDIERVEVLKGPQGTLYGEGSVGGTIRFITNDPELDSIGGNLSFNYAQTQGGDLSQEVKGVFNIPVIEDKLGMRLVGQYSNSGGWIDQPGLARADINDQELHNLRGKLLWLPSGSIAVEVSAITHRNDTGAQNNAEDDDGNFIDSGPFNVVRSGQDNYDIYSLEVAYDTDSVVVTSATGYSEADKSINNWSYRCCFLATSPDFESLAGLLAPINKTSADIFTQELRVSSSKGGPMHWTFGGFYREADIITADTSPDGLVVAGLGAFPPFFSREDSDSFALFGEASYELTERLEMGVGLRYFEDERESRVAPEGPVSKNRFDNLSPKIFISYELNENANIFGSIAEGFRSGGFNTLSGIGAPGYDPETVRSYETGVKSYLMGGRLYFEGAVFFSEYEDYQIVGVDPIALINITSNTGDAEILGGEITFTFNFSNDLGFGFTGSYLDTEFTSVLSASTSHIEGDPLDLVAEYNFSFWAEYNFSWFDGSDGGFRFDYAQQGEENYRNRSLDDPNVGLVYHATSDTLKLLNARLVWTNENLSAELYSNNLLGENGHTTGLHLDLSGSRPRPRTVGLNIAYTF